MVLLITFFLVAIGFSFYCSVAEAVLLSVNKPYILLLKKEGKKSGDLLFQYKQHINRPLSAILTLNTIAHTVGAAGVGAQATQLWGNASIGVVSAVLTFLILIFSEIIPKTLGAHYWRQLASLIAYTLNPLIWILKPFIYLSDIITAQISGGKIEQSFTRTELAALADLGENEGELDHQESKIFKNLFSLRETSIQNIMTPRRVIFVLSQDMTVEEYFSKHDSPRFSRIPIYNKEPDDFVGFVLRSDLLLAQAKGHNDSLLSEYHRHFTSLLMNTSVLSAYETLLSNREHLLIVIDEYGSPIGLVTLEDIMETLLGSEIIDESDETADMQKLAVKKWQARVEKIGFKQNKTRN